MKIESVIIHHLVKGGDLNHHGTLFAGRGAEWMVEAGFIATSSVLPAKYLLCMNIHGMRFKRPVEAGEVVRFTSRVVFTGRSRLITHIKAETKGEPTVDGFITFVYIDDHGKSRPHGLVVEAETEEERALQQQAAAL
jgi:acyl-CoA hydrolase